MKSYGFLFAVGFNYAESLPFFPDYVPNGRNVVFEGSLWVPLGHHDRDQPSGELLNPFGQDVRSSLSGGAPDWQAICELDSDGDGRTNGEELLDPTCSWTPGADDVLVAGNATHPGFDDENPNFEAEVPTAIKVHAALMTLAWLFFAPIGILAAAAFKPGGLSEGKWIDWFKIHKLAVGTAVYLTSVAYVVMVHEKEEFLLDNKHTKFGHAVVFLALFQPLTGFFRLHIRRDGTKSMARKIWEYFHQWTGRTLAILAVCALYYGYDISVFFEDGVRNAMKAVSILILILGGLAAVGFVFLRRKNQTSPALPVKRADNPTFNGGKSMDAAEVKGEAPVEEPMEEVLQEPQPEVAQQQPKVEAVEEKKN